MNINRGARFYSCRGVIQYTTYNRPSMSLFSCFPVTVFSDCRTNSRSANSTYIQNRNNPLQCIFSIMSATPDTGLYSVKEYRGTSVFFDSVYLPYENKRDRLITPLRNYKNRNNPLQCISSIIIPISVRYTKCSWV